MIRRALLPFAILVAATPARAQPGADEPPPPIIVLTPAPVVVSGASQQAPGAAEQPPVLPAVPAPQNEPWINVSHINGHPVPVGERGDFLYKWKKTNIASNPIGWMLGFYGISVSQAISNNVAIRGDVNMIDIIDSNTKGYEFGASVPIYFKRVFQGPFLEPGIIIRDFDDKEEFGPSDNASIGPSIVFGWHWTFDSGLNVAAAVGFMRNLNKQEMDEYGDNDTLEGSGYFRVGYAF